MLIDSQTPHPQPPNRQQMTTMSYCYVKLRGLFRPASVKVFFTDDTLMVDFLKLARQHGEVKGVEFPVPQERITTEEVTIAMTENRILY